ncbi:LysE-type translocator [Proteus mirabilis]|uniref:LysE-type translocator n=1 Tax=Proteus mirabilis TaxID=584 RepID=A0A2X2C285_PROMI|nr:LysE-type translocator [Proteus mirabilis]
MTISLVVSLSVFLFIAAITPGPNNLLLTSSGAHVGLKTLFNVDGRHYRRNAMCIT